MPKNKNLETVFFHELGHFVANKLINELYNIFEIEEVLLIQKYTNEVDYEGQTKRKIPLGKADTPLKNMPERLCSLIYGCYFQTIYQDTNINMCFNQSSDFKGCQDYLDFAECLRMFKIESKTKRDLLAYLTVEYYGNLKEGDSLSKSLFEIDPRNYLVEIQGGYKFDIIKLENNIQSHIKQHRPTFAQCISRIKSILNWEQIKEH
ncbi:hypothetical protein JoomaDRAFT_1779 [Galbibacter orientalis DSM 19592]|uniref:Uncharacterized protein n=1 Tax=Galbibacter orientalis DSM 19592 TaxID=926559 RepID=I3C593_9FLAO|nr:hypothetical protein [Galbibacter orientalis]EIJ38786.1 hypothetical protein JoomaDRAFT_1779 [Galbibacter orientalis DSM 19592]